MKLVSIQSLLALSSLVKVSAYYDCGDRDTTESFKYKGKKTKCNKIFRMKFVDKEEACSTGDITTDCPFTCGTCCDDSDDTFKYGKKQYDCTSLAALETGTSKQKQLFKDICASWKGAYYCGITCTSCYKSFESDAPSESPSAKPSESPTVGPSATPTSKPSAGPTTSFPTDEPSIGPSAEPSLGPTSDPSSAPSLDPSSSPTVEPSVDPSSAPSVAPSVAPSPQPSGGTPSGAPSTPIPSKLPSTLPTVPPTMSPTSSPSSMPSPICIDTVGKFDIVGMNEKGRCKKYNKHKKYCKNDSFREACPKSCKACTEVF